MPLSKSKKLIEKVNESIDSKVFQIIIEARDKILGLNPDFESTGIIERDLRISKTQQTVYERAINIYKLLERNPDELHEKGIPYPFSYS